MIKKVAIFASGSGSNAENIIRFFSDEKNVIFPFILGVPFLIRQLFRAGKSLKIIFRAKSVFYPKRRQILTRFHLTRKQASTQGGIGKYRYLRLRVPSTIRLFRLTCQSRQSIREKDFFHLRQAVIWAGKRKRL